MGQSPITDENGRRRQPGAVGESLPLGIAFAPTGDGDCSSSGTNPIHLMTATAAMHRPRRVRPQADREPRRPRCWPHIDERRFPVQRRLHPDAAPRPANQWDAFPRLTYDGSSTRVSYDCVQKPGRGHEAFDKVRREGIVSRGRAASNASGTGRAARPLEHGTPITHAEIDEIARAQGGDHRVGRHRPRPDGWWNTFTETATGPKMVAGLTGSAPPGPDLEVGAVACDNMPWRTSSRAWRAVPGPLHCLACGHGHDARRVWTWTRWPPTRADGGLRVKARSLPDEGDRWCGLPINRSR